MHALSRHPVATPQLASAPSAGSSLQHRRASGSYASSSNPSSFVGQPLCLTPLPRAAHSRRVAFTPQHVRCAADVGGWYADESQVYLPRRSLSILRRRVDDSSEEGGVNNDDSGSSSSSVGVAAELPGAKERLAQAQRELFTVNIAIGANVAIMVAKLVVYVLSGSSALLAEAIHSLADVGNQVLLRMGIMRSKRDPTPEHPYGYARDKFIWSLISAVGIFCLGSGVTIAHGVSNLFVQKELEHMGATLSVLAVSLLLEGISLHVAVRTVAEGARARGMAFWEYVKRGMDPTSVAVMMEDGGAVAGLLVAAASTYAVKMTGHSMYDAIGSICVGTLLGAIAVFLIQRNRQLLIGRSMNAQDMRRIMEHLRRDPVVKAVHDAKSEEIGPGLYRFKAEIDFSGEMVVDRYMSRVGRDALLAKLKAAGWTEDSRALELVLQEYGKEIISSVGSEVDRIEAEIQSLVPGVRYVDLETDRGLAGAAFGAALGPNAASSILAGSVLGSSAASAGGGAGAASNALTAGQFAASVLRKHAGGNGAGGNGSGGHGVNGKGGNGGVPPAQAPPHST